MKGKLVVKVKSNKLQYEITLKRNVTILQGDSATGKTKLFEMINLYNKGRKGIIVESSVPCRSVDASACDIPVLKTIENSIVIMDEDCTIMRTKEFASYVKSSSNYFILITRESLKCLPYSIKEIYVVKDSGKYGLVKPVLDVLEPRFTFTKESEAIVDKEFKNVLVEDKNSGYQFYNNVINSRYNCKSLDGIGNVCSIESVDEDTLFIIDGAAAGAYIEYLSKLNVSGHVVVYAPESFEFILLLAGIGSCSIDMLTNTYNYCESSEFFSWERFFTELLTKLTENTELKYTKSKLNNKYLEDGNYYKIVKLLPKFIRDMQ